MVNNPPASVGDVGSFHGSRRSLGVGNGNPLQYSCLGNPWREESGRLQSKGLQRVVSELVTKQQHSCVEYLLFSR